MAASKNTSYKVHVQENTDANFVNNGSYWQITATGGTAKIWDIIYFIQKTQSYA